MDKSLYLRPDDTRVAIFVANQLLDDALERGGLDDPREGMLLDLVDIQICSTLRVMQQWSELVSVEDLPSALIRDTLIVLANALATYTEQALTLAPPQRVAAARHHMAACSRTT